MRRSSQRCVPPGQEFLCEEHADLKDEATYEDAKGIRRKRMHAAKPQLGCQITFPVVRQEIEGLSGSIRRARPDRKSWQCLSHDKREVLM